MVKDSRGPLSDQTLLLFWLASSSVSFCSAHFSCLWDSYPLLCLLSSAGLLFSVWSSSPCITYWIASPDHNLVSFSSLKDHTPVLLVFQLLYAFLSNFNIVYDRRASLLSVMIRLC